MVIGEAPGREEDRRGRPFIGESGRLLRTELQKAGFDPSDIYITNVIKCRPPDNRDPKPEELKACRRYLDAEIAEIKPKYIITAGRFSSKTVLKKSKITQDHGNLVEGPSFTGMPVYHPAYCLRDSSRLPGLAHDLKRLRRHIDGTLGEIDEFTYRVVHSAEDFQEFLEEFRKAEEYAHDTETSGLFPHDRKGFIRCLGIGLPRGSWVIPLEMPGSKLEGKPEIQKAVGAIIRAEGCKKTKIAQNGKFDCHWEHYYLGGRLGNDFDTMLAHHILDENQDHDLKYMSRVELDCPEYDLSTKDKKGGNLATPQGREQFWEYCARDAWNTLRLKRIFAKRLATDLRLRRLFYRLVMPASRALERAERRGLQLDMRRRAEVERDTRQKLDIIFEELNDLAGRPINWNSPAQVAKLLYDDLGLPCTVRTGAGNASTSEAALVDLKRLSPVVEKLVTYRELGKFLSTYLEGWEEITVDGRLYVSYKIHGTVTGRYSSRLHSIPRDGTIRNLGTAPPGWKFVQADLSQAELRIAAELSGDLELISCFRPGGADVHWRTLLYMIASGRAAEYTEQTKKTANLLRLGTEREKISLSEALEILKDYGHEKAIEVWKGWKEARKKAKAINFGFIYGMYEKKFIENAKTKYDWDCTWDEAHDFRTSYFELYRGIPAWHDKQKRLVKLNGYVTNLFGRMRRLPGIYSSDKMLRMECERQAINSPVQGTIGDWKAAALIEIDETLDPEQFMLVGEHHDAILGQVREGCEDEILPQIRRIMRSPKLLKTFKINPKVPMESEIEVGPWGAGIKYEADLK